MMESEFQNHVGPAGKRKKRQQQKEEEKKLLKEQAEREAAAMAEILDLSQAGSPKQENQNNQVLSPKASLINQHATSN